MTATLPLSAPNCIPIYETQIHLLEQEYATGLANGRRPHDLKKLKKNITTLQYEVSLMQGLQVVAN